MNNEQLVETLITCFNNKDAASLTHLVTDDIRHTAGGTAFSAEIKGREPFLEYMNESVFAKFINIKFIPYSIIQDHDRGIVGIEWTGEFDLKNGNSFSSQGIFVLDITEGKVSWIRDYFDTEKTKNAAKG